MIIDTHAHLYFDNLANKIDEITDRARDAGIDKIILPSIDINTAEDVIKLSQKYDMLYCAVGIHPSEIRDINEKEIYEIEVLAKEKKVVAIGEIGLDYYWDQSYNDKQIDFFKKQLILATSLDLPVIIHTRNSIHDAITTLFEMKSYPKCQFHCFSGVVNELEELLKLKNIYVSFCGNITYKNYRLADVIKKVPIDRIVFETDSPFLTPIPFRGKINEPSYIINTIAKISEIKNNNYEDVIQSGYQNTLELFDKLI